MSVQSQRQSLQGLTSDEVAERRAQGLGTVPPPATSRSYRQIIRENVFTTVNILLFSIGFALVFVGQYLDSLVSVCVISFNLVISLIQEIRAKRTLDRIALLTRPKATVMRDGQEQQLDPGEIVVDDILVLHPGDQIVVDGPVISGGRIEVDESLLTGESDLITKHEGDRLYSGTFCVAGQASYRAEKVGIQSVAGILTVGARAYRAIYTPLERDINLIIRILLLIAIFLEVLLIVASVVSLIPIVETVRMAMVIIGIVPNGLFLSISVAYALGAVRMAGKGALVQKFNAIESLSHVDVLCTDKTGTLTANMLAVEALHPYGREEAEFRQVLGSYIATMSSSNATSAAIRVACAQQAKQELHVREEIPFSSARKWSALVVDDKRFRGVYVLGAPEMLQPFLRAGTELGTFIEEQVAQGMRVLLFAWYPEPTQIQAPEGEDSLPYGLVPLGAVSLHDTLRPEARETLARFTEVGVQVKVISGDHPQTVAALARQVGLPPDIKAISGAELETLDDTQLAEVAQEVTIFGRITPHQKERLVLALRSRGHYVAMIGDGVNDVLALKQANLGIAMQSGSQATRGAADLVLLKDTFASLPAAFREGQRIRNGMSDILKLFLTRVLSVTLLLISIAFIGGFPFQPRQTSLLTFLTVGVPALALAYWARPGRVSQRGLMRSLVRFVLPASLTFCLVAIGVYLAVLLPAVSTLPEPANPYREGALPLAQTALTVFAVLCGLALVIFAQPPARPHHAGHRGNWLPTLMVLGLFACLMGVLTIAPLRALFNLQMLDAVDYLIIGGATVLWGVLIQTIWRFHLFERFLQLEWKDSSIEDAGGSSPPALLASHKPYMNNTGLPDLATINGLSEQEAQRRLKQEGYNELPSSRRRSLLTLALGVVREPMFLLLIAAGTIYLLLGDMREALVLLGSILLIMSITFYQEQKTERALEALRDLSSPRALVIRDSEQKRIAGREVVRGDLVVLAEGDRVPADGILLWGLNLSVDESLLTGESVPVRKMAVDSSAITAGMGRPGGDDLPFVFSGTLVTQGQGIAEIHATGPLTELGKIGTALQTVKPGQTRLQRETGRLVRLFAIAGLTLCALVVVLYGLFRGDWLNGLLAGIALAMSLLPEEFPVVLTVFLALGAWRIAQRHVLTRHMPAIETLGAATVLCVDKTGTLTENRMSVRSLFAKGSSYEVQANAQQPLPEVFHELVELSILASQQDPFDPMEQALRGLGERYLSETEHLPADWTLLREYPLSPQLLAISHVWRPSGSEAAYVIAAKGAPEAIVDLCHLDEAGKEAVFAQVSHMAGEGLRVLGVARAKFQPTEILPPGQHDFSFEFVGLVGLADPVRSAVPAAIQECYTAGMRVIMITGDYPATAQHIGRQIGLHPLDACITGPELEAMDDVTLQERIKTTTIFARVVPEQKLRLVNALKANGEVVAMTGDGVNDAPALKSAHIGVAMGKRGTDVARESAALVLLDDDFSSIVQAIRLGRRIYDNIRKALTYILAVHVPIAGIALLPLLFGWPLVLLPVHIVFLELIIDPASSVVFEAEPENPQVMKRAPRDPREPMFGKQAGLSGMLQGIAALVTVLVVFGLSQYWHLGEPTTRALAFTTLVIANLGLILANRSHSRLILATLRTRNAALWWVVGGTILLLGLVLYIPGVRDLFDFSPLSPLELAICLTAGIASCLCFDVLKVVTRKRDSR